MTLFSLLIEPIMTADAANALVQAGSGNELRPFWYVFLAYASAWLVIGGWLFSMAKRLSRLEERLGRES